MTATPDAVDAWRPTPRKKGGRWGGEVGTQERSGGWERDREEGGRRTH